MDNFKRINKPKHKSSSVDGFLPTADSGNLEPGRHGRSQPTPKTTPGGQPLADFSRPDGMHVMQHPGLADAPKGSNTGDDVFSRYRNLAPQNSVGSAMDHASKKSKRDKKPRSWKRVLKRASLVFLILILATGGYFGVKLYLTGKSIFKGGNGAPALAKTVDISKLNGEGDGRINILLIGKGGDNHPGGELTDTMLLASIDPIQKEAAIVSIPRDLWVKIPNQGYSKLNAAYAYGKSASKSKDKDQVEADGVKNLYDTLTPVIGIPIHYYVMFDFTAYKNVVDTVGGIDITLDEAIYDPNFDWQYGRNALKLPKGNVHLSGTQALLLGRARGAAGGYGVGTDFDRNENQRKMLIALRDKILSANTYANPVKVNQILTQLGSHVHTSFSSVDELKRLYEIMSTIQKSNISSLDLVTPPHNYLTTGNVSGLSVVYPKAGVGQYAELQNFIRNTLKDGFLKNESATVAVYNATTSNGLAGTKADELRSYGYIVTTVANAPTRGTAKTVIVDLSGGTKKYTKRYLEQRFKVTAVTKMPADQNITPGTVDFVIILGQDATTSSTNP